MGQRLLTKGSLRVVPFHQGTVIRELVIFITQSSGTGPYQSHALAFTCELLVGGLLLDIYWGCTGAPAGSTYQWWVSLRLDAASATRVKVLV